MTQNRTLSRSTYDVGLGIFRELLNYKAVEAGVEVVKVDPYDTSQICSECGVLVDKNLGERIHSCHICGLVLDRDVNAARNILALGQNRSDGAIRR